jgi:hypothetical protein
MLKTLKSKIYFALIIIILLCYFFWPKTVYYGGHQIEPTKTETAAFDIATATEMIQKGEKIIADIAIKDTVSRREFNQFLNDLDDSYGGSDEIGWEYMFFYNSEFEDEQIATIHLNKTMFYPTIYHKDVEVVSALIENAYYNDKSLNTCILIIREEYLGEDSKLKGWYRENLFQKNDEDKWVFYRFNGQQNLLGEGITSDYLKLK